MKTSQEIKAISKAIVAAQPEIAAAIKTSINPHFKSKYADLSAVWEACKDVLKSHKLAVIQTFSSENKDGTVLVKTRLVHDSGEWMEGELPMPYKDNNPQAVGSAITYARRYSLSAMLGIVTEEDDDANHASQQTYAKPIPKEPARSFDKHEKLLTRILEDTPLEGDEFLEGLRGISKNITAKKFTELTERQVDYINENFDSTVAKILNSQTAEK